MKFIIMCGGNYNYWKTPKQLSIINGERLVDRTIRLLKENNVEEIYISSNNPIFDSCNVPRLINTKNDFDVKETETQGYWLDAFYPVEESVTYLFGDVYYSEEAIKKIVEFKSNRNILFGSKIALNKLHKNWGEPFAYIVNDYKLFFDGINNVKELFNQGKVERHPIVWELYRYLHGLDINKHEIIDDYEVIDDETIDIDGPEELEEMQKKYGDK